MDFALCAMVADIGEVEVAGQHEDPTMTFLHRLAPMAALIATLWMPGLASAQANRATFPASFDKMVMYGDYRRGSVGELAYALPETIAIAKAGEPLPPGTSLVLEIYDGGALTSYFVMEKGKDWGLDFTEETRTEDWHFQQFGIGKTVQRTGIAEQCRSCHSSQVANDYMFTTERMLSYVP